ncbi:helix-turn-helix transcriptional regulator [Streptomyces sp. NPDC006976]|uniref:helix-turn-helix domain-containing protein n=1 Tax=Streptomyces sp. NPDC006976 TaxID=3154311 RepID=UPI003407A880
MADDKKTTLGPTGEQVRANVQRLRESAGLTKKELSERVGALGRAIPPLGISRIEQGTRRVDADDLVALAVALNVHPGALLLPSTATAEGVAEITAVGSVPARQAWEWAHGMRPLPPGGDGRKWMEWRLRALPFGWRPMSPEEYAEWDLNEARASHKRILDLTGFNEDGSRKEEGNDGPSVD